MYSVPKKYYPPLKIFGTIVTGAITGAGRCDDPVMILAASQSPVSSHGVMTSTAPAAGAQFLSDHNISSIYLVIIHLATLSFNCSWKCPVIGVCVSVFTWWRHSITRQFVSDGWWLCHKTRWNPTTLAAASCWCDALIVKLSPQQFQSSTETSS